MSECIYVHLSESACLLCDGFACSILCFLCVCMNVGVRKPLCVACWGVSVYAYIHTVYMHAFVNVCVCMCVMCVGVPLYVCVYIQCICIYL